MNNPEEVSLRPAANSMLFKKNANPPKPSMGLNSGEALILKNLLHLSSFGLIYLLSSYLICAKLIESN